MSNRNENVVGMCSHGNNMVTCSLCRIKRARQSNEYTTMHVTSQQLNERMQLSGSANHNITFINKSGCIESKPIDVTKSKEDNKG